MWRKLRDEGPDMIGKLVSDMERLANTPNSGVSREQATRFGKEMEGFRAILRTYQAGLDSGSQAVDWSKVSTQNIDQIIQPYESCSDNTASHLNKLAIVKLNGGLGTTMGCTGPKSVIEVRDGKTFLDLIVDQVCAIKGQTGVSVPLVLMNSFNTQEETGHVIKRYRSMVDIFSFEQSQHPRFFPDSHYPAVGEISKATLAAKQMWYPPGHGDVFEALVNSGTLDALEKMGIEYVFISNVDNLGATVDPRILNKMISSDAEFIMELTQKTEADVKVFNTNNIWVSVAAIKRVVADRSLGGMELIENSKKLPDGRSVIQLERAMGSAIRFFRNAYGIQVPRSRFLPVKKTDDLLLIQSNLYELQDGQLTMSPKRKLPGTPLVKLDAAHFGTVKDFNSRFASIPDILELSHFTVSGDVSFGFGVSLKGTVIIVSHPGSRIDVPSGSLLQSSVVSGNMKILNV